MPETIKYKGRSYKFFTQDEVDGGSKSPDTYTPVPVEVLESNGLQGPLFYYVGGNPMGATLPWTVAPAKEPEFTPEFLQIWTDGKGPLNGPEVRYQEELHGVKIDDSTAMRAYNKKLADDMALFGGVVSEDQLADALGRVDAANLRRAVDWTTGVVGAVPVFFAFKHDQVISEDVWFVEGVRHAQLAKAAKLPTIGIAFPGPHAKKRDVFNLTEFLGGKKNPLAAGKKAVDLPGRDRWFRLIGTEALSTFIYAPWLVATSIQVSQVLEGRDVTMERSPVVPQWMWEG